MQIAYSLKINVYIEIKRKKLYLKGKKPWIKKANSFNIYMYMVYNIYLFLSISAFIFCFSKRNKVKTSNKYITYNGYSLQLKMLPIYTLKGIKFYFAFSIVPVQFDRKFKTCYLYVSCIQCVYPLNQCLC